MQITPEVNKEQVSNANEKKKIKSRLTDFLWSFSYYYRIIVAVLIYFFYPAFCFSLIA